MSLKEKFGETSISTKILWVNLPLLLALMITFLVVTGYSHSRLDSELSNTNMRNLNSFEVDVEIEKSRLKNLMLLCAEDSDFILSLSGRQDSMFIRYGLAASKQLSAIKFALPYATQVFAYSTVQEKFILAGASIQTKESFVTSFSKDLAPQELVPDFEFMENGYYIFNEFVLYVVNIQNYGFICVQFDPKQFIDSITKINDYELLVLTEKNQVFATSATTNFEPTMIVELSNLNPEKAQKINYEKYDVYGSTNLSTKYKYYLFNNTDRYLKEYFQGSILLVVGATFVLLISALIVLLNSKIYRPFRVLANKFSEDNERNEILRIQSGISGLEVRNLEMSQQVSNLKKIEHDIALTCLLHAKEPIDSSVLNSLRLAYPRYSVIYITFQTAEGTVDKKAAENLTDTLCRLHGCIVLKNDDFSYFYLWQYLVENADIEKEISDSLSKAEDACVMVGISQVYTDISRIKQAAEESVLAVEEIVINHACIHNVQINFYSPAPKNTLNISLEQQNSFANTVLTLTSKDIAAQLEKLLFGGGVVTVGTVCAGYNTLISLSVVIRETANIHIQASDYPDIPPYNPQYIFNTLLAIFSSFNVAYNEGKGNLKYQVMDFINENVKEDISVSFVSEHFNLTPNYFSTWFKKAVGCSFVSYLTGIRMEMAKKILTENYSMKISQISENVGIHNVITFNRQFKAYVGTTPEQFRKQQRSDVNE